MNVSQSLWLATGVHAVALRDDLVFLDIPNDRYICLPGAAPSLILGDGGAADVLDPSVGDVLSESGLIATGPPTDPRLAANLPALTGEVRDGRPGAVDRMRAAIFALASAGLFRSLTLSGLIAEAQRCRSGARPACGADPDLLGAAFDIAMPWLPLEGLCLQRSFLLLRFLARSGIAADWVFGVRSWPFVAHCWVQVDDRLIGDRLDHVRAFTPILRV